MYLRIESPAIESTEIEYPHIVGLYVPCIILSLEDSMTGYAPRLVQCDPVSFIIFS